MGELIIQIIGGFVIIAIGIMNVKGNISLLHSYHRKRVKEEDILPFGKKVGSGTIIMGVTMIAAGITDMLAPDITNIVLTVGFIPGIILIVYAMLKYNKGIF